jgi:hypothetical protein
MAIMIPITVPMAIHTLILTINHTRLDPDTTITAKEVMGIIITRIITQPRVVVPVSQECAVLAVYFKCVFFDHSIHSYISNFLLPNYSNQTPPYISSGSAWDRVKP